MENRELKSILQDALESKFPASQIDLLPKVREHLVAGTIQQGEKMNTVPSRRLSRLALAALAVVVLLTIAFVTPQGRAFAQSILQLFRRSDSYTLPLPEEQLSHTGKASAPTAMPPAPLVSIQAAEKMTGFDAKVLSGDPKGFTFAGAMASGDGISIQYQAQGNGGQLIINESNNGFMESDWDRAPAEFITPVKVGGLDAEVVQGAYVVYPGATNAQWNPEAPIIRLRWIEDGIWFEMAKFGGVESISYLDPDGMIALAENMVYAP
jgi:hypothetical protein